MVLHRTQNIGVLGQRQHADIEHNKIKACSKSAQFLLTCLNALDWRIPTRCPAVVQHLQD